MKIYTRGGDRGQTALIGGQRRYKDDVRIEAYGTVDEAGAFIGLAASFLDNERDLDLLLILGEVQQQLWDVGADLAAPADAKYTHRTSSEAESMLEPLIDRYKEEADQVTKFIVRGGATASSALHVACTVIRRAERRVVELMQVEEIHAPTLTYLNRLSDLLFVLARAANAREHQQDVEYRNSGRVF